MKEYSDSNFSIAHFGPNFWRQLVAETPSFNFESDNAFLLFLDDDGHLLDCCHLTSGKASCADVINACKALKRFLEVSAVVRIQTQSAYEKDPFCINGLQTQTLYTFADLYNFHLADVVLPRFN